MTSTIKVNKIEKESGSTITLGGPSTAVTLACGATQSGFGRTGTVDWCTTAKTSPLTAVSGNGYFINTTGGAITVTLPSSPSAGDIISLKDYANTWDNNNVTLGRGGSKINGKCTCATLNTESQSVTMIYVDGTKGWQDVQDSTSNITGAAFVTATGGTITTVCTNYKVHTFLADGCFQVTCAGNSAGNNKISYLVVGGGGAAGAWGGGGGAAGGFREGKVSGDPFTASPLVAPDGVTASVATFPIVVGGGGVGKPYPSRNTTTKGSNSSALGIAAAGGAVGAPNCGFPNHNCGATVGNGGSGGGGQGGGSPHAAGTGNTPPVSPPQGNTGGSGTTNAPVGYMGGGGGGAAAPNSVGGNGGAGATSSINASPVARAGGGGGGTVCNPANSTGGTGGGGNGGAGGGSNPGTNGTANTGGGGGGAGATNPTGTSAGSGASGGSGIVILRYKFQ